jgi:hypothetical protein
MSLVEGRLDCQKGKRLFQIDRDPLDNLGHCTCHAVNPGTHEPRSVHETFGRQGTY